MNPNEIEQKARRLKMLKNRRDAMDARIEQLEAELKEDLGKEGTGGTARRAVYGDLEVDPFDTI